MNAEQVLAPIGLTEQDQKRAKIEAEVRDSIRVQNIQNGDLVELYYRCEGLDMEPMRGRVFLRIADLDFVEGRGVVKVQIGDAAIRTRNISTIRKIVERV